MASLQGTVSRLFLTHIFQKILGSWGLTESRKTNDSLPANSVTTGRGVGRDGHQCETLNRMSKSLGLVLGNFLSFLSCGSGTSRILQVSLNPRKTESGKSISCKRTPWLALLLIILPFDLHLVDQVHPPLKKKKISDSLNIRVWLSPKQRHPPRAEIKGASSRWEVSRTSMGTVPRGGDWGPSEVAHPRRAGEPLLWDTLWERQLVRMTVRGGAGQRSSLPLRVRQTGEGKAETRATPRP